MIVCGSEVGKHKGLTYSVSKSGLKYYYLRRPGGPRVRLGTEKNTVSQIMSNYQAAVSVRPDFSWIDGWARRAVDKAKCRGKEVSITSVDVVKLISRQSYKCSITGRQFSDEPSTTSRRRPLMPSIDRIDNAEGYTLGNIRIVTVIANMARSDFSDDELERFLLK